MFHITRLFGACLALFIIIGSSQTSFATAPKIDENGRLILPNPVQLPKLPTNSEQFFKNNNAYEYRATLYIQGVVGATDATKGYTLYSQRAYNEIKSVLGHTPRWHVWSDKIKERIDSDGSIEIIGQLTTNGIQNKGDHLGHAAFRTISNNSRDSTKNHAFTAILPEINARNQFVDQMERAGNDILPRDRAKFIEDYLYQSTQAKPNEYRAPYAFNPRYHQYSSNGEYYGREADHTTCIKYTYYGINGQKICRSTPMSAWERTKQGISGTYQVASDHINQVWQDTNDQARQDRDQMTAGENTPQDLNVAGRLAYQGNGVFSAAMLAPNAFLNTIRANQAAEQAYNNYAPDTLKQAVSNTATAYNNWAQENPNSAQITQFGFNVATTLTGAKAGLAGKMGRGNDDFGSATTTANHADDAFARVGDYDLGNVYDRQKQHDLKPSQQNNQHNQKAGETPVFPTQAGNDKRTPQNTQSNTKPNTTTSNPLGGVAVGVNANLPKQVNASSASSNTTTSNTSPIDKGGMGNSTYSNTSNISQNHHTPLAGVHPTQHGGGTWQDANNSQNARGASGFPIYTNNGKITQQTQSNTTTSALLTTTVVGVNNNGARQVGQPTQLGAQTVADTTQNRHLEQEQQALARIKENYSDTERKNNLDYRYKPANSTLQLRDFQNQVLEARKSLPSDLRRGGNVAVAEIHIDGLDIKKMAAHSQIRQAKNGFVGNANTRFESETIANKKGRDIDRKVDSEYKILANLADKLNNNPNAKGNVIIFTERAACSSCKNVVEQFKQKYPHIDVKIMHNHSNQVLPPKMQ